MGSVWRAHDLRTRAEVAVKRLDAGDSTALSGEHGPLPADFGIAPPLSGPVVAAAVLLFVG
jgi:hypothetical protein